MPAQLPRATVSALNPLVDTTDHRDTFAKIACVTSYLQSLSISDIDTTDDHQSAMYYILECVRSAALYEAGLGEEA